MTNKVPEVISVRGSQVTSEPPQDLKSQQQNSEPKKEENEKTPSATAPDAGN